MAFVVAVRSLIRSVSEDRQLRVLVAYNKALNLVTSEEVKRAITAGRLEKLPEVDNGHQGWVLFALQIAFHQMFHAESFEKGLVSTVMLGGDADTNGCIAGALLGAMFGQAGIPTRWAETCLSCEAPRPADYRTRDLLELADKLALCGDPQPSPI